MWNNKKLILVAILSAFILFLSIWLIFNINGPFLVGKNLEKRDWLSFLSGFLSFAGTIIITTVIIIQNHRYKEMDLERLRLQNMPNLKFKKVDVYNEFEFQTLNELKSRTLNPQHRNVLEQSGISGEELVSTVNDCPLIIMKNDKLKIHGEIESQRIFLEKEADLLVFCSATNYGIGPAIKLEVSIKEKDGIEDENYDYGGVHLKEGEKIYFEIALKSLVKSNEFNIVFSFVDIFGTKYQQNWSFNMIIEGTQFNFNLSKMDNKPILVK